MNGSATLTMVESSTIISCPRQTTTRAAQRRRFEFITASKTTEPM